VTLLRVPTPRGKAFALNVGVAVARGETILFADARQLFDCGAIRALVRNFADPKVGAVSGTLLLNEAGREDLGKGLALYWPFEKFLRKVESRSGSTIGCTGAIYAVRRALFSPLPEGTLLDDVLTPMRILLCGYRVVFEDQACAFDRLSASLSQEFDRKVRTLAGNVQLLYLEPALLSPLGGAATWRFISHKFLPRVLMPYCLATLLLVSIPLDGLLYRGALAFQVMVYVAGLFGLFLGPHVGRLLGLPSAFLLLNAACVVGAVRYTCGLGRELWRGQHA
jgi:cellulose synthase/poly-beta-1,6-N-acetylglucosamine synthase-like glycosyltransferase